MCKIGKDRIFWSLQAALSSFLLVSLTAVSCIVLPDLITE